MKDAVMEVVGTHFCSLQDRLAERDLPLWIGDTFKDRLISAVFGPVYGARPLKRAIQKELENLQAQRLLAGEFPRRNDYCRCKGRG